jgi:hypothetical protein
VKSRVRAIFICLSFGVLTQASYSEKGFLKFSSDRKTFESESAHVAKLSSDILAKAASPHLKQKFPQPSKEYQRPLELAIEWQLRNNDNKKYQLKDEQILERVVRVKSPVYFDQLLNAKLSSFQKNFFSMGKQALVNKRKEYREFLLKSRKGLIKQSKHFKWWEWFLAEDSEVSKYEFNGFDASQSPLLQAVSFYFARIFLQEEIPFQDLLETRYILNGDSEARAYLAGFDSGPMTKYFVNLKDQDSSLWKPVLLYLDEPRLISQRMSVISKWIGDNLPEWKKERLLSSYLRDKVALGESLVAAELFELVILRLNQGQVKEASEVLKMIPKTEGNAHQIYYLTGRMFENLASKQKEPLRTQTLKWAAEKYRLSLNNQGAFSALRDEILGRYATVLGKSGLKVESSEVWETFFRAGLTRESRLKALRSWIHLLFDLSEDSGVVTRMEKFRKAVSLSGFYAQAGVEQDEVRQLSARIRFIRRLLRIENDSALEASLFEIERAGKKNRVKN